MEKCNKPYFLLLFALIFQYASAQSPLRNFSTEEYRAGTQNWSITQGKDDRMVFANNNGMLTFDGYHWSIKHIPNNTTARSLLYDNQGNRIYVGASGELGYYHTDRNTMREHYVSLVQQLPKEERNFTEIWRIHKWNGSIVFQGYHHIYVFTGDKYLRTIRSQQRIEVSAIINNKLVVVGKEYMEITDKNIHVSRISLPKEIQGSTIREVLPFAGGILLCTANKGLLIYKNRTFLPYSTGIDNILKSEQIFSAAIANGRLALGTVRKGLFVKDLKNGAIQHYSVENGLKNNTVLSVFFDHHNNLWLGLDNGIAFVDRSSASSPMLPANVSIGTGYASLLDGGKVYLGTNQGLYLASISSDYMIQGMPQAVSGIQGQVWCITKVADTILCGTDNGTFVVSGTSASKIEGPVGTWAICELKKRSGYLLGSDYTGMFVMKKSGNSYVFAGRVNDLQLVSSQLYEDKDGTIWVNHWQDGIYHIWLSSDVMSVQHLEHFGKNNGLPSDGGNTLSLVDGRIYIGATDGFHTYDRQKHQLRKENALSKLFGTHGESKKLHRTADGSIWAYNQSYLGIARNTEGTSQFSEYRTDSTSFRSLVPRLQMGLGAISNVSSRYTLFNSNDGFHLIDNSYRNSQEKNHLYIHSITGINDADSLLYSHTGGDKEEILIPHNQNSIRIDFVMAEYRGSDAVNYSCYLEGYDHGWSAEQTASYKEYTHLSRGHYRFHVKARNLINGYVSEKVIEFDVEPAFYETFWAYLIYIIIIALMLRGFYLLAKKRNRQALEQERMLQEKELAATRAQNLEDELKHKSNELASSTMSLVHQNDILQDLEQEMSKLSESVRREEPKKEITRRISEIRRSIQHNLNDDNNWERFEQSFDLVYNDLIHRLSEQYPDLKMNDRKLCAYLRLGLSSKEIASLLNTTTRSIETARYRLRKKLNLEAGDNLSEFIQNF